MKLKINPAGNLNYFDAQQAGNVSGLQKIDLHTPQFFESFRNSDAIDLTVREIKVFERCLKEIGTAEDRSRQSKFFQAYFGPEGFFERTVAEGRVFPLGFREIGISKGTVPQGQFLAAALREIGAVAAAVVDSCLFPEAFAEIAVGKITIFYSD